MAGSGRPVDQPSTGYPRSRRAQWLVFLVVVVAVSAGIVATQYAPQSSCNFCLGCIPPSSGPTPLGSAFAMGSPVPEGGPSNHSYRIPVTPSSGIHWSDLRFHLTDSSGGNVTPAAGWAVWTFSNESETGAPFAKFDIATQQWTPGASVLITSAQLLSLELGSTNLSGQGDTLVLLGADGCGNDEGTVSASLP